MATAVKIMAHVGRTINGKPVCGACGNEVEALPATDAPRVHVKSGEARCKNLSRKEVRAYGKSREWVAANAYEVWQSPDGSWTYYVLAKRQTDDLQQYAIWLCACVSPFETDMAGHDTYASDVRSHCRRIA